MILKRTKIVCTIGPASASEETLRAMIEAGMNVARLNFSHGTYEDHAELIRKIRAVSASLGEPIALLQDLQGPKIRVGDLPKEGVELKTGGLVTFTTGEPDVAALKLPVTYERLHQDVKAGERILLDDGLLSAKVREVRGMDVVCEVIDGGKLTSHKGVNFPDSKLTVSSITDKDKADVAFGVKQGVDFIALSFVRSAKEIHELRVLIEAHAKEPGMPEFAAPIRVIAKIEKREAVDRMDEVIAAVDAIMVARGDMGIEMPAEKVPIVQKDLIAACRAAAKPVIVATQMLDSMIRNPRATRAEISDIANAVIDHADAVMLSGESASGKYPVEAVRTMASVILETEASPYDDLDVAHRRGDARDADEAMAEVANVLVRDVDVKAILVATALGETARRVSRFRPDPPTVAVTDDPRVQRQLCLSWGVVAALLPAQDDVEAFLTAGASMLKARGLAASGDRVVLVAGEPVGRAIDRVEIVQIP